MNYTAIELQKQLKEQYRYNPLLFLKFSKNIQHLEKIQAGSLYMNNFQYYIDLEEQSGIAGMGDKTEASLIMHDLDVTISSFESEDIIQQFTAESTIQRNKEAVKRPLFCLYTITIDMCEIVEIKDDKVKCRVNFSKEQLASMKEEFGENVLIIEGMPFINRVNKSFAEKKYTYAYGFAKYMDYSILDEKRFKDHQERNERMFFYKDKKFAHQKEYRIVILNKEITEGQPEQIDSLERFSAIRNIAFLENVDISIDIPIHHQLL